MEKIAVLGLGAMGSRMASNLLRAGHTLTVWNRTPGAADSLVQAGAQRAPTPAEAVRDARFVMAMVRDDEASREVWLAPETGAFAGMQPDTMVIESSTLTPGWVRELGVMAATAGFRMVEAPVSGTRPQAEAAQLIYLIGGSDVAVAAARPVLEKMGNAFYHVGALGSGALAKLCTNTLLGTQVTVLAELVTMLQHQNADAGRILEAVAGTAVWSPTCSRASQGMLNGQFAPQFPVELIAKDFSYTVDTAGSAQAAPTIAAARDVFRQGIEQGLGALNMTSVVQLFADKN